MRCPACAFGAAVLEVSGGLSFFDCEQCEATGWWSYGPGDKPAREVISWFDETETRAATVTVDGQPIPKVLECSPGKDGWAWALKQDESGKTRIARKEGRTDFETFIQRGEVKVEWQTTSGS